MYKGEPIIPEPMGKHNIVMPPSSRPKGLGRRHPHSSNFTRNRAKGNTDKEADIAAIAISNGLDKISLFFTGKKTNRKVTINKTNPFEKMMNFILNNK